MYSYILWNPNVFAFHIGTFGVRWYSLCWVVGIVLAAILEQRLYKEQRIPDEKFDPLFLYSLIGIVVGARLGHCLFYEPLYFLSHPIEIFLPMKQDVMGNWHYTGYEGLASHGGTLGLIIALWLFIKKTGLKFILVLDNIAIVTPIAACAIRLGNLMNSEILGRPTDVPWAFIFERVDQLPRHPGQLYEALCYALFFFIHWYFYRKYPQKVGTGFFFGLCLTLIFTARILIEYTKENQEDFENGMLFNMGQLLSVPFVILGIYCMLRSKKVKREK